MTQDTALHRTGILLAAFGSASPVGTNALSAFEQVTKKNYPHTPIRWAFTSEMMRSHLAHAKVKSDSVYKALNKMRFEKFTKIAVQPLHIISGQEYASLCKEVQQAKEESGIHITIGKPLMYSKSSVPCVAKALLQHLPPERKSNEPVIWVAHGTWHPAHALYEELALEVQKRDPFVFLNTLERNKNISDIFASIQKNLTFQQGSHHIWLLPLLSVIGRHAMYDIAGEHQGSWQSCIETAGHTCTAVLTGTVEYSTFISIWADHLSTAMATLEKI